LEGGTPCATSFLRPAPAPPFCELLFVFITATRISVGLEDEFGIRLDRKVFLEVTGDRAQCILLALDQPAIWIPGCRLSRSEVNAAERQTRRRLRWFHHRLRFHRK